MKPRTMRALLRKAAAPLEHGPLIAKMDREERDAFLAATHKRRLVELSDDINPAWAGRHKGRRRCLAMLQRAMAALGAK